MNRFRSYAAPITILMLSSVLVAAMLQAQAPNAPAPQTRPKLIVVIVVDQMRADYIDRFHDRWRAGLRRLVDQGAWLRNAAYPYAATETCPGHATISTGVFPAKHGIVGNTWWDRQSAARVTCTQDSSSHNVAIDRTIDRTAAAGDSPSLLLAPSLAEQLRAAVPGSRVVTMSVKARSAIMLAGHHAEAVLWMDDSTGEMLTSTAYGAATPAFAGQFIAANPLSADFSKTWKLGAPAATYTGGKSVLGEAPPRGWTATFPHPFSAGEKTPSSPFFQRWEASPFADAYLERLAAAAIDEMKLGSGRGVDFLGIGFSATDYIGHTFGPDSREIEDDLLVLDKTIGALLDKLDRTVGAGQYVVALTADHGVSPIPEQWQAQGRDAGRIDPRSITDRIEKALTEKLGAGKYVAQMIGAELYFAQGFADRLVRDPDLMRTVQEAALAEPGVQNFLPRPTQPLLGRTQSDLILALQRDQFSQRSGDAYVGLKPNWLFSTRTATGWSGGTSHGTSHDYDQRVPIVLFGRGIKPGKYTMSATPADIAPTLASVSGITIAPTDGQILREALAATPATRRAR